MAVGALSGASNAQKVMAYSVFSGEALNSQDAGKMQVASQVAQMLHDTVQISQAGRALAASQG
ncbi:MAG: hypothetical protein M3081_22325 [Gemmatimonadota bacterium]|nr:hypothetical protein [Gemmatimonadota bacterium]